MLRDSPPGTLELEVTPNPSERDWKHSEKLHKELFKVIMKEIIKRPDRVTREAVLLSESVTRAYAYLPESGRDAIDSTARGGE